MTQTEMVKTLKINYASINTISLANVEKLRGIIKKLPAGFLAEIIKESVKFCDTVALTELKNRDLVTKTEQ